MLFLLLACPTSSTTPDEATPTAVGRCAYINAFSQANECKEYTGAGWTAEAAETDCAAPMPGASGVFEAELACERTDALGECFIAEDTDDASTLVFLDGPNATCDGLQLGCDFAQGRYVPSEVCANGGGPGGVADGVFTPFEQVCRDPIAGEPAGNSTGGQVCTWQAISGATEEGRRFSDYASCEAVITQRPYYPAPATSTVDTGTERLADDDWKAEYDWVTSQIESSACVCCHSTQDAPNGTSGWFLESGEIWTDSFDDDGLAMMAGWVDSSVFGAFDPEDNNGFSRDITGTPTTDVDRMQAFFASELALRGLDESDFTDTPPFGGFLYDQLLYEPSSCGSEGIEADGTMNWSGGDARYIYLLESGADAPGVPPNLDLPDGTLWRLDVAPTAAAVASGIRYGSEPEGATQAWPVSGDAPELISGTDYYLYVLKDIYQPLTRCEFTAP